MQKIAADPPQGRPPRIGRADPAAGLGHYDLRARFDQRRWLLFITSDSQYDDRRACRSRRFQLAEPSEQAFCVVCQEPIRLGATTCIHCGSSQGWQRHLSVSSTVLALLVALISVLQSALPTLFEMYRG